MTNITFKTDFPKNIKELFIDACIRLNVICKLNIPIIIPPSMGNNTNLLLSEYQSLFKKIIQQHFFDYVIDDLETGTRMENPVPGVVLAYRIPNIGSLNGRLEINCFIYPGNKQILCRLYYFQNKKIDKFMWTAEFVVR